MKLVIFDLDQTLVDLLLLHDEAAEKTFQDFFNVKARLTEIDFAGRSLMENFVELAKLKNIPEDKVNERSQELLESYEKFFVQNFPQNPSRHILPGVKELLKHLSETKYFVVLYTGDSPNIANKVLAATTLSQYFRFSVCGTEARTRADMVKLAINKADKLSGRRFKGKDIVIIGDSPRDIECGQQFQALTIAVATGLHSEEELSKHKPDYVFVSLEDHSKVLEAIG
jgi:phosphoglycolate phosphatase